MASIEKKPIQMTDGMLIPERDEKSVFSAWRLTFFGVIALLIIAPIWKQDPFWEIIRFLEHIL